MGKSKFMDFEKINKGEIKKKNSVEMPNVAKMESVNARYHINYDDHRTDINPNILDDCDGLVMEMRGNYDDPKETQEWIEHFSHSKQFARVIMDAAKNKKPIYFVDLIESKKVDNFSKERERKELTIPFIEMMMGSALGVHLIYKDLAGDKKMTRREFLKSGLQAIAATYLETPFIQQTAWDIATKHGTALTDEKSTSRKVEKILNRINNDIHPELRTIIVDARNDLMAQKTETIAKILSKKLKKKPELAIIIGARHSGIEQSLTDKEEDRVKRLRRDFGEELSKNASVAEIDFAKGEGNTIYFKIEILKDPALDENF